MARNVEVVKMVIILALAILVYPAPPSYHTVSDVLVLPFLHATNAISAMPSIQQHTPAIIAHITLLIA